jgi:hypothetical protein
MTQRPFLPTAAWQLSGLLYQQCLPVPSTAQNVPAAAGKARKTAARINKTSFIYSAECLPQHLNDAAERAV